VDHDINTEVLHKVALLKSCAKLHKFAQRCTMLHEVAPGQTDRREKMENPKKDNLCNNGTFSNNLLIQYEKNQIVLKTLLCTMMKEIEKLEEILKSMGQPCPNRSPAARKKPVAENEGPTYRPKLDSVSPQMGTLQKILELNGIYGPPPKQPIHNSGLRAGQRSLFKYNFDRKEYLNKKRRQNKTKFWQNQPWPRLPNQQRR
jgi:hypothetical protein